MQSLLAVYGMNPKISHSLRWCHTLLQIAKYAGVMKWINNYNFTWIILVLVLVIVTKITLGRMREEARCSLVPDDKELGHALLLLMVFPGGTS